MFNNNLVSQSVSAVCGITEREITVPKSQHRSTIRKLDKKGYFIVGDSEVPGIKQTGPIKIWFTPRGSFL